MIDDKKTVAFQVPADLFEQFKAYLKSTTSNKMPSSWTASSGLSQMMRNPKPPKKRAETGISAAGELGGADCLKGAISCSFTLKI